MSTIITIIITYPTIITVLFLLYKGLVAVMSLIYKRSYNTLSIRPFHIWFLDCSKQGIYIYIYK